MSCVVCGSYGVQMRPAVDVLVVPYSLRRCKDKDSFWKYSYLLCHVCAYICPPATYSPITTVKFGI